MYPFKFEPILKSLIWGGEKICSFKNLQSSQSKIGESWDISTVRGNISVIANGDLKGRELTDVIDSYKEQIVGKHVYDRFGSQFPLLIKFIDACDNLSIQVHPDDEMAKKRHDGVGKTEMWYIISAEEGAGIYCGFSEKMTKEEFAQSIKNNTVTDKLRFYPVKPGDTFFLPAGRVHALGKGTFIAEIQQTSDLTYRIYDYDRRDAQGNPRELHIELAQEATNFEVIEDERIPYSREKNKAVNLAQCPYFTTNVLDLTAPVEIEIKSRDSFAVYICMQGEVDVTTTDNYTVTMKQGETILVPAAVDGITITPRCESKLLESYVE